jgi:membrane associated rhomboid family serine protease
MIFLRYESLREYLRYYPVTSAILALNLLVFLADLVLEGRPLFEAGAFVQHPVFDRYGLLEPWRYVTSIFLHAGWEHLLFNAFSILVFAPPLERLIGHFRYAVFWLLAGILGNVFSAAVNLGGDFRVAVGASGAVYGVFGAYLYLALFRKHAMDEASRKTVYSILLFGLLYSVISPRIDIWAHAGGCLAGFLMLGMLVQSRGR